MTKLSHVAALLVLLLCLGCEGARQFSDIAFHARSINPKADPLLSARIQAKTSRHHPTRNDIFLVQLKGPVTEAMKKSVNDALAPFHLGQYVAANTFMVVGSAAAVTGVESHPAVSWTGHLEADLRVQPNIERLASLQLQKIQARAATKTVHLVAALPNGSWRFQQRSLTEVEALAAVWRAELPKDVSVSVSSHRRIRVEVPYERLSVVIPQLAVLPELAWLEAAPVFETSNYYGKSVMQTGVDASTTSPFWTAGLDGTGQVVGCADSGLDVSSCFFSDPTENVAYWPATNTNHRKIISYQPYVDNTDEVLGHGTHVVGSILGNANDNTYTASNGLARGAKVFFNDIGDTDTGALDVPDDLTLLLDPVYSSGARIHSDSWGISTVDENGQVFGTYYTLTSSECDDFTDQNRDFLMLIAAGNDGESGPETVGAPATAKNVIAVAAALNTHPSWLAFCGIGGTPPTTYEADCAASSSSLITDNPDIYNSDNMAPFSGQGPLTDDGRIKPDLAAPGYFVVSASSSGPALSDYCASNQGVRASAGTSMATPLSAGAAAIVRQYFAEGYYPSGSANAADAFNVPASVLKAVLLNGARAMTGLNLESGDPLGVLPSYTQGYGFVDLQTTLYVESIAGTAPFYILSKEDFSVETDALHTWCFNGVAGAGKLKIMLVWTDPAASANAVTALVNDLDLVVTAPNGDKKFGNGPLTDNTLDGVNNVEQVIVNQDSGEFCAEISGWNVPVGPQNYALVVMGSATNVPSEPTIGGKESPAAALVASLATVVAALALALMAM